jgi:3,4-dihydroxy 2-butanone 4-phosphate synthase/GTP cyclohydrolase II
MSVTETYLARIEDVIEDARNGRMYILVDDESRENEGDLIIPAQMATPEAVNFMAKYGRGLICLALTRKRVEDLGLNFMVPNNQSRHQTAFTVSIEAKDGITTGISAHDRAHTVAVAIDPECRRDDIASPGHIFPLQARDGGVLVRAGHTEAAVDVARLAGLIPAGVICEVMNDDGTMARLPDLLLFAKQHGLKVATIADLIAYRRKHDRLVRSVAESDIESAFGGSFRAKVYANTIDNSEHLALVKGDIATGGPVLVRMHVGNLFEDMLGVGPRHGQLQEAMRLIGREGRGVVVCLREPNQHVLSELVSRTAEKAPTPPAPELRTYGIGAQILIDLGVHEMILLSNTRRTVIGLEGYDLHIVEQRDISLGEEG